MRAHLNLSYPFFKYTKAKIMQTCKAIVNQCDSDRYRGACSHVLGRRGKIEFSTPEIIRIMYELSKSKEFKETQVITIKNMQSYTNFSN